MRQWITFFCCIMWAAAAYALGGVDQAPCARVDCHGLNIECEIAREARSCDAVYSMQDLCQPFASCMMDEGACVLKKSEKFDVCVACIRGCEEEYAANRAGGYELVHSCEMKCRELLGMRQEPPSQTGDDIVPGSGF